MGDAEQRARARVNALGIRSGQVRIFPQSNTAIWGYTRREPQTFGRILDFENCVDLANFYSPRPTALFWNQWFRSLGQTPQNGWHQPMTRRPVTSTSRCQDEPEVS